ncbi:MAG: hypothetical protein NC201_02645 [Prevotella sp.]|nr:hypothetical protein [Bacteroides sp.]MCM1366124.1 hypothetical protein [Prevotella sp.]MCM1436811.1 hypothetical protein [Prevotella sp.]
MKTSRILLLIPFALCFLYFGCSKKVYVPVDRYIMRHDSLKTSSRITDSVTLRDSIFLEVRGDTVHKEIVRWRFRDRLVQDTVLKHISDTVKIATIIPAPDQRQERLSKASLTTGLVVALILAVLLLLIWKMIVRRWLNQS